MAQSKSNNQVIPKLTLYWLERSRAQRIVFLLEELHLPYTLVAYTRNADGSADASLSTIHPLGVSPALKVEWPDHPDPIILVESAMIIEYICEYLGPHLLPQKFPTGYAAVPGTETEAWRRNKFYMAWGEASVMPFISVSFVRDRLKTSAPLPMKPLTYLLAHGLNTGFLIPRFTRLFDFLESQIKTSGGDYICGEKLSAADIMLVFVLEVSIAKTGLMNKEKYPATMEYYERLLTRETYERGVERVRAETGGYKSSAD